LNAVVRIPTLPFMNFATVFAGSPWLRWLRNATLILVALFAVYALLGFFALPWYAKSKIESLASTELGRSATVGKVEFNPLTLRARVSDFSLADREPNHTLLRFETLDVDLSAATLWKWAPVFDAVRLVRPRLELSRHADDAYNVQDLVERVRAQPKGPTPKFSINNIEIEDGTLALDDRRLKRSVAVTQVGIGIPFLSSLPYDAQIRVTPRLDGAVDGAKFKLAGNSTSPFADTGEATLELNLDALSLPRYAAYAPLPSGLKLSDGALTTRLTLAFVTENRAPRALTLTGTARLDGLAIARGDNSPLASAKSIEVALDKVDPLGRSIALSRLAVDGAEADVRRFPDGAIEFDRLLGAPTTGDKAGDRAAAAAPPPWKWSITEAHVANSVLRVTDEAVTPAFRATLSGVAVDAKKMASSGEGSVDVAFDSNTGAHFAAHGDVDVANKSARGHFALTTFHLDLLYPYYADALNLDVRRGTLDLAADFSVDALAVPAQLTLAQGAATMADLDLGVRGEPDPLWRIPRADLAGVAFDYAKRSVTIERVESQRATFRLARQESGSINFERLMRTNTATGTPAAGAPGANADAGWALLIRKLQLERIAADFEDRAVQPPVKLKLGDARIAVDNYSNAHDAKGTVTFATRVGAGGQLQFTGGFATNPFSADWRVNASGLDIVPLRPYFEAHTNVIVTGGAVGAKGRLTYGATGNAAARATFAGDVSITDFASLDRPTSQELVRWKALTLTAVDATSEPLKIALGAVALDQFYARVIVNADATLNLQRLLAPESAASDAAVPKTPAATSTAAGATSKEMPASASTDKDLPVSIGRIELSHGEVQFSDFFIKPNYSAHLTEVAGSVSALSAARAGDVELAARVENTAPVEVHGSLNPFARVLTLDLTANARDIDLPPLTPYSSKYAGYGIQKGKLSFEVHYKIDDRKLTASNKLVLDQLTFGEHVESPTATKLPVLLAVSLLKDRNGVIRLDLPISGSLDDPKFSVGGVIIQIIVNLLTKIVTAPLAVLGTIVGGAHSDQLAYVEFAPGAVALTPDAETKLRTLAKALADRPALKLDAAGRAVPDVDRDGLKRVALDRAMRIQKQKALAGQGASAPAVDTLTIDGPEHDKYLALVYRDADLPDKPRNAIGMAKDIPPAEMEALLLASYRTDDEQLRALANRRALVVKEWFVGPGAIASDRVFIVAAKLGGDGIADKGAPTRVDFTIR
jgi:uncharacterized protein involved in outer membrane biogenesis